MEADKALNNAEAVLHLAVCRRFGEAVRSGERKWDRPSPCEVWDARGVLEHVVGFHDSCCCGHRD